MPTRIRHATAHDCDRIAEILNNEILHGSAHFGTEPEDHAAVEAAWRADRAVYPWLVAEHDDRPDAGVLGFARAARWKTRRAYDWACESAIYVHESARGLGVGKALYRELFAELERRGFRCVIAGVTLPNPASERLHESLGMTDAGTLADVGFKHGAWRSVRYYTRTLGDGSPPTAPPGDPDTTT